MKKMLTSIMQICLLGCLIVAAVSVATPDATAYAATPEQGNIRLENLLMREQIVLNNQQQRLDLSNQVVTAAQTWIAHLQDQSKDVAALQDALAAFQAGISQAQTSFNTAQSTLSAHNGFDANGKVTDNVQALKTLTQAGQAERQFHLTITQATIDFRQAVQQYRQANQ